MNTAIRAVAAEGIRARRGTFRITLKGAGMILLVIGILFSAFGVIYVKDLNRRLFIDYQNLQAEKARTLIQWGKLLLEQSTWSTQSRIQQVGERELGMVCRGAGDIVLVESNDATTTR